MEKGEAAAADGSLDADKVDAVEEDEEVWSEDAMGSLSMGAILTLKVSYIVVFLGSQNIIADYVAHYRCSRIYPGPSLM